MGIPFQKVRANINIIDIRWYKNGNPTQKGVRINEEEFPLLVKALETITRRNKNDNIKTKNNNYINR
mgnify:CR=1 FL=1